MKKAYLATALGVAMSFSLGTTAFAYELAPGWRSCMGNERKMAV